MTFLLRHLILPPGCFLLVLLAALLLWERRPKLAKGLVGATLVSAYALSTLPIAILLTRATQQVQPLQDSEIKGCQAVVVLGGGVRHKAPHRKLATESGDATLARLDYAAEVALRSNLPVLACGGGDEHVEHTEAYAMAEDLHDLGVKQVWLEPESSNTAENAAFAKKILEANQISQIVLVTSASHMERAAAAFRGQGLTVVTAPMHFETREYFKSGLGSFVPRISEFTDSTIALQSILGQLWYKIRY